MLQNQQLNMDQTQHQQPLHIQQQGQTITPQAEQTVIPQAQRSAIPQARHTVIPQAGQTVLQQLGQAVRQQPGQVGIQQQGQAVIQTTDLPILTARTLQQALQQLGNVNNFVPNNQALPGPVLDNTASTIYTVLSTVGVQLQQPAQSLQSTAPLLVLPTTTATTQTPITCNAVTVPCTSSAADILHDILPEGATVQDVIISASAVNGQDKENLSHDQSSQENTNGLPSLSGE
jgi:hypothetical protein